MDRDEIVVAESGERLDRYLASRRVDLSRALAQRLIDEGMALVNGRRQRASYRLRAGDSISLRLPPPQPSTAQPENIPLRIVYEDADMIVIDKPAGMVVHPSAGHDAGTIVNAVLAHAPDVADLGDGVAPLRPGIVHRLDKDTSGLLVVAKNEQALRFLSEQFKQRATEKTYVALLHGHLSPARGEIEAPIGRDPRFRQRMAVVAGGRAARTGYSIVRYVGACTLVEAMPHSGRTHQIRVHFASIGHPVAGDSVYGAKPGLAGLHRQFLHATRLRIRLPSSGDWGEFASPLPPDLTAVLAQLDTSVAPI